MPINRDFYRRWQWNFCEKTTQIATLRDINSGPKAVKRFGCLSFEGTCLPFWMKKKKYADSASFSEKMLNFAAKSVIDDNKKEKET